MSDFGQSLLEVGALAAHMSRSSALETASFLHALPAFFGSEFSNFDNINIHGVGVSSFGGGGEGLVGLVSRFGVLFGNLVCAFPLGLEGDGLLIPAINGGGDCVHRHDLAHEGRGDARREVSNKDILVSDADEGGVILEMRDILDKGRGVGVVLPLGYAFSGEPGDGVTSGVMMSECSLKFLDEVGEGSNSDDSSRDSILSGGGCPGGGGSFGHVGQGECNFLVIVIVDLLIDKEVELYSIQPLGGLFIGSIKGFQCSDMEFGRF